jgi:ubiquinone/menaquinone biosynthesis C-methylase UbiE
MKTKITNHIFAREKHVCPCWLCFSFDNFFRRLVHNPKKILSPYVKEGNTVLDVGPGMGYFSISLAELAGVTGSVIACDIQEKMLKALQARAGKAGLTDRIQTRLATEDSLGIERKVDFILAFWMVHEVPDKMRFLAELHSLLKPQGLFLLVEPILHVTDRMFDETTRVALDAGFAIRDRPRVALSRAALLRPQTESNPSL